MLAREAEAAKWGKRRQSYGVVGGGGKRDASPWVAAAPAPAPTVGFPPMTPPMNHFRPLHVWGHPTPTLDHSFIHLWPKHLPPHSPLLSPPLAWALPMAPPPPTPPPAPDPPYWQQRVNSLFFFSVC